MLISEASQNVVNITFHPTFGCLQVLEVSVPGSFVDEEGLAQIIQILAEQQAGLQHLTKILQKDQKDLAIILGKTGSAEDEYLHEGGGESLWTSTSTLRASSLR